MIQNYSEHPIEVNKKNSAHKQLLSAFTSIRFLTYAAIIILLLLISASGKSQTYPASFS